MADSTPQPRSPAWKRWWRPASWALLAIGLAYLGFTFGVGGWKYAQLKMQMSKAREQLQAARWQDPALRCGDARLGPHFRKLFSHPEIFATRIIWDQRAPRLEFYVSGLARPRDDVQARHLLITVELLPDGGALPTAAVLAGEDNRLESARTLLAAACAKPG